MSDLMLCAHCHAQHPPGSKFCNNCGTSVQPVTTRRCPPLPNR
ncbi:MAG: zinc-ribbon domain-containing protein [Ardenticatenaceae bacterium]|nr:zinc-ribbon domain-containing protein [Ardenticatenaceae bacterium]